MLRWHGDDAARRSVYANRARLLSGVARVALVLDRGGMRRTWLRGRDNVATRYLIHVAGHNLGLLMRTLFGAAGTPRAAADLRLFWLAAGDHLLFVLFAPQGTGTNTPPAAIAIITVAPDGAFATGRYPS